MSQYLFDDERQKKLKGVYWQGLQKNQTKLKNFKGGKFENSNEND